MRAVTDIKVRRRLILLFITIATLPCYCLGLVLIRVAPDPGAVTPTASPTASMMPSLTATAVPSATWTRTPTASMTASATATLTATATATATASPTASASPTGTETPVENQEP